jgi:hypothetical protein
MTTAAVSRPGSGLARLVDIVLVGLVAADIVLAGIILVSGQAWFDLVHGTDYVDPQGLLKRTGAQWASLALFEGIALVRWRSAPYWLMLVAGLRFGDLFSDWGYRFAADDLTFLGNVGLLLATPLNLVLGVFFFRAYLALRPSAQS